MNAGLGFLSKRPEIFASSNLPGPQESPDKLALAADNHLRESLEPLTLRHFRICGHPTCE